MYKLLSLLFLGLTGLFSCVKPPSEDPVPTLSYERVEVMGQTLDPAGNRSDTAVLVFSYSDGDGDVFRDKSENVPNLLYATYIFNADSNKFINDKPDGIYYGAVITQPANGYYKGRAIHGEIFLPMKGFRTNLTDSILRFEAFIVDMKGNKSNVVISPTFTLDF